MKKCPFCAEEIQDEAIKCKHCGEFLDPELNPALKKTKWYFKTSTLVLVFLTIGPLVLPLVWFNPAYSKSKKFLLTIIIVILSILLARMMMSYLQQFNQSLQQLRDMGVSI